MVLQFKKWNKTAAILLFVVLAVQNFAMLLPQSEYIIPGLLKFSDIGLLLSLFWTLWCYVMVRPRKRIHYSYGLLIILFFILTVISAGMANYHFSQPISHGIRSMRNLLISLLLYFPVTRVLQCGILKRDQLLKILFFVGTLELLVYTLQFLLAGVVQFTYIDTTEMLYGSARLRVPFLLQIILGFYCLSAFLETGHMTVHAKSKHLFYFLWCFLFVALICKHRAPTLLIVATAGVGFLLWKKNISQKVVLGILAVVCLLIFAANSTLMESAIDTLLNKKGNNDTLSIRRMGQLHYIQQLATSPWFGFGFPNISTAAAVEAAGINQAFFLVDNGIIGFAYIQGIAGIIWLALLYGKMLCNAIRLHKRNITYFYLLYIVYELGNLYMGMHWYYYYSLPFAMVLALLDFDNFNVQKQLVER